jgi:signal transduction histidine kinase
MVNAYSRQSRAERLIAAGRVVLAAFFLLAIWLDPFEPSRYARITYITLTCYLGYALILVIVIWHTNIPRGCWQIITHALDLTIFVVIIFFTQGPTSPFFVFFVFSLVCATLRWQWRGTLWTAAAALTAVFAMTWFPMDFLRDPDFLNRFVTRVVHLAVVAVLLGYLGAHEQKLRSELSELAAWPQTIPAEITALAQGILEHAAGTLNAPRVLLTWEEAEEPWLYLASWSRGEFHHSREAPGIFGTLVAENLADTSFFCLDACVSQPMIVYSSPNGLKRMQGNPLQPRLQAHFAMRAVLASKLKGDSLEGYLFALDKPHMTSDDLVTGQIVAHQIITQMNHFYLLKQLQQTAVMKERIRLARDLHDGLLQSLTVAALQLETVQQLMKVEPQTARDHLLGIQRLISAEQRDLRFHIQELKPFAHSSSEINTNLPVRLQELADRIKRHWGLRVEVDFRLLEHGICRTLAREIYFIVHESLINAARHAKASVAQVEAAMEKQHLCITVADNGRGFPFRGCYDHAALIRLNVGPVTLKERIASLGGSLTITSSDTGTRLEITLPFAEKG